MQFSSQIDTPHIKIRSRLGACMGACTLTIYMLGAETLPKDKCTYVFNRRVITIGCWVGNPPWVNSSVTCPSRPTRTHASLITCRGISNVISMCRRCYITFQRAVVMSVAQSLNNAFGNAQCGWV